MGKLLFDANGIGKCSNTVNLDEDRIIDLKRKVIRGHQTRPGHQKTTVRKFAFAKEVRGQFGMGAFHPVNLN